MSVTSRLVVGAKAAHVALYRRFDVRALRTIMGQPILLLTVAGRRSGVDRTTPVVYLRRGNGSYVVAGSNGGQKAEPQWFRNLRAATTATAEVGDTTHQVAVRVLEGAEYDEVWTELVARAPFFEGYRTKSGRQIPLAALTPAG
jgi:deazaflavin-dependent oxidoreductase (nitroreductase family)